MLSTQQHHFGSLIYSSAGEYINMRREEKKNKRRWSKYNPSLLVQEKTGKKAKGKWTSEEHEQFIKGVKKHGKDWVKVTVMVKTRSVSQVRTHAQKFFKRVENYLIKMKLEVPKGLSSTSNQSSAAAVSVLFSEKNKAHAPLAYNMSFKEDIESGSSSPSQATKRRKRAQKSRENIPRESQKELDDLCPIFDFLDNVFGFGQDILDDL